MNLGEIDAGPRLGQAISSYLSALPLSDREATGRELSRFARWIGPDIPISSISPILVARYQEQFPESSVDVNSRLEPVKVFLTSLKTHKLTRVNLGAHIRLQRQATRRRRNAEDTQTVVENIRITEQGFASLTGELEHLENVVRPQATEELGRAYGDRDFRENAPYDAAKQKLAQVQGRIDEIRRTLTAASIYVGDSTDRVDLGTRVTLHSMQDEEMVVYTIVGAGEVSPREGRISTQSPVGRALLDRRVGDVVEVLTPAGVETFRVEQIERGT